MGDCCKVGFNWGGKPTGSETTVGSNKTYVTGNTSSDKAIVIVHDVFGWTFPNLRLLADHYAKEVGATAYLPDFFNGEVIDPSMLEDPEKRKTFDLMAFIGRNSKDIRYPEMQSFFKELKSKHKKVGAIGYCYGGWAVFKLGAKGNSYVDAISTAHPSLLTKEEVDAVGVPVQILAPEMDQMYTQELKDYTNSKIPTLGVPYSYEFFHGVSHGFAAKGDQNNKLQKDSLERAKNAAVYWFKEYLS